MLDEIGTEKHQVDHQERRDQGHLRPERPNPWAPHDDEGARCRYHHGSGDGDAMDTRQFRPRAECQDPVGES